ncbi:FtsK/SpoIIIE domain-containing protein [Mycetocola sp. 2940]|uniref:FtsK/SpoIIIE domain-containing protein n=1 Tax=Mycetocola sp. 2940 TaxID=3156452 RepID=UPI00339659BE
MSVSPDEPITVPAEPSPIAPSPFPVVASLAPVVASVAIWALTRSPFVLVFAMLGPIIAVASVVDNRWSTRRRLRSDTVVYRAELDRLGAEVDERHADERRRRCASSAGARRILDAPSASSIGFGRWRASASRRFVVVAGRGDQPSAVRVDGPPGEGTARLRHRARVVSEVPVEIDATGGIGVVGPPLLTTAVARGLLVQLCAAASPEALSLVGAPPGWEWTSRLPHRAGAGAVRRGASSMLVAEATADSGASADILLVISDRLDRIPTRCSCVLELTGIATAMLHRTTASGPADHLSLTVDLISAAEARAFADDLAVHALQAGVGDEDAGLPASVGFSDVSVEAPPPTSGPFLSAVIGSTAAGPVCVDIVADGPHAIVGGTTGSGKSELLVTWVASIAERYPPDAVTLLLVDFKGGAAFAPLLGLPHVVGVLTDLDSGSAARALDSLRAEIRYRERFLRDREARDIATVPSLPRLVIVVDEFAAMLDGFPDLHALFVDVAARGRSLGLHLILCTQRPAGVVRDSLLANCGLRMSLRVNNRADSAAILGTDAAAFLPVALPGRLVLAGSSPVTVQVATATANEIARVGSRWPSTVPVRRPWLDPLPAWVDRGSLDERADGIRLGLADLPAEQRQDTVVWNPDADGSLLVVGMARTGKTTLLNSIAAEAARLAPLVVERIGADPELAWDVVHALSDALNRPRTGEPGVLVLIDDLDSLLAGIDGDDAIELRDGILTLLRDGPRRGLHVVVAMQRLSGPTAALGGFVGSTVLLGTANRQEHLLAGGDGGNWVEARRAGSALWRGVEVQLCAPEPPAGTTPRHAASRTVSTVDWGSKPLWLVVSATPARRADALRAAAGAASLPGNGLRAAAGAASLPGNGLRAAAGAASLPGSSGSGSPSQPLVAVAVLGDPSSGRITVEQIRRHTGGSVVIVGDSEQWQAHWSLLTALRQEAVVIVDGCSVAEFRALTRIRDRPPLLARLPGRAWTVDPGGSVKRVSLAPPARDDPPG